MISTTEAIESAEARLALALIVRHMGLDVAAIPLDVADSVQALVAERDALLRAANAWAPPGGLSRSKDLARVPVETIEAAFEAGGWTRVRQVPEGSFWRHPRAGFDAALPTDENDGGYPARVAECLRGYALVTGESPVAILARWLPTVEGTTP